MEQPPLVLLVDDIPDHAKLYEAALRQQGYRVHLVHTGTAALVFGNAQVPDCVVIDDRLPDMEGWELCRQMKADSELKNTPVVILTTEVTEAVAGHGAKSGCSAWLAHPTLAQDLPRVVQQVLAQGRPSPQSERDAVVGQITCKGCGSDRVRATLRLGVTQYFSCRACNLSWRVDSTEIVA